MDIMDSITVQDIITVQLCPEDRGHGGRGRPARRTAGVVRHVHVSSAEVSTSGQVTARSNEIRYEYEFLH